MPTTFTMTKLCVFPLACTVLLALWLPACGGQDASRKAPSPTPPAVPDGPGSVVLPMTSVSTPALVPTDDGFRLEFSLTDGETSKDSHQIVWFCRIEGHSAVYSGPHGDCERGQCPHRETKFNLTAAQRAGVIAVLEAQDLLRDHETVRPVKGIGKWVRSSLQVTRDGRATRLRVEGMTNEWGRTEGKTVLDADARTVLSAFDALRRRLAGLAKGQFAGYHEN